MKFALWTVIVALALTAATSPVKGIPTASSTLNTTTDGDNTNDSGVIGLRMFSYSLGYTILDDFAFGGMSMLQLCLDTARPVTWVADEDCETCSAAAYHTEWSPTYKKTGDNFVLDFVDIIGPIKLNGSWGTDEFYYGDAISGVSIKDVRFGIANISNDRPHPYLDSSAGVIGLGRQKQDEKQPGSSFLSAAITAGVIKKRMFGVLYNRVDEYGARWGRVTFGGFDNYNPSGMHYHSLLPETDAWEIGLTDVLLNGSSLGYQRTALFDTASWTIRVPKKDAKEIFQKIPGSKPDKNGIYKIPRNSNVVITLKFGGNEYSMKAGDMCYNNLESDKESTCSAAIQAGDTDKWSIGHPFLINVYTVFDEDNKRIGITQRTDY